MGYYDKPVNRTDKSGAKRSEHYKSNDSEIDFAKRSDEYGVRSDAFAEGDGYLGLDNLDRLRREKLKHETR